MFLQSIPNWIFVLALVVALFYVLIEIIRRVLCIDKRMKMMEDIHTQLKEIYWKLEEKSKR